jgi:hypothetical protein
VCVHIVVIRVLEEGDPDDVIAAGQGAEHSTTVKLELRFSIDLCWVSSVRGIGMACLLRHECWLCSWASLVMRSLRRRLWIKGSMRFRSKDH